MNKFSSSRCQKDFSAIRIAMETLGTGEELYFQALDLANTRKEVRERLHPQLIYKDNEISSGYYMLKPPTDRGFDNVVNVQLDEALTNSYLHYYSKVNNNNNSNSESSGHGALDDGVELASKEFQFEQAMQRELKQAVSSLQQELSYYPATASANISVASQPKLPTGIVATVPLGTAVVNMFVLDVSRRSMEIKKLLRFNDRRMDKENEPVDHAKLLSELVKILLNHSKKSVELCFTDVVVSIIYISIKSQSVAFCACGEFSWTCF